MDNWAFWKFVHFFAFFYVKLATTQCPSRVLYPCTCAPDSFKAISVVCDKTPSFDAFRDALPASRILIDHLVIANTAVPKLHSNAFTGYAVRRLTLRNNSLKEVDQLAFDGSLLISTLNVLEIRQNQLDSVPNLSHLRNVTSLILADNQISRLQPGLFRNFEFRRRLENLDLSGNSLRYVDTDAFVGLDFLRQLNLDKNFLQEIPAPAIVRLPSLITLTLNANQIARITASQLPFSNLRSLSLESNQIRQIEQDSFRLTSQLLHLYLGGNRLDFFDPNIFAYTPNLQVLALGDSQIRSVGLYLFKFTPNLIRLDLPNCGIEGLEPGAFRMTPKLEIIVLARNRLTEIKSSTFQGLTELYSVNLKANRITAIENHAFADLKNLKLLDLSSNNLSFLDPLVFFNTFDRTVPISTRVLYIYDNPWNCDSELNLFRNWLRGQSDLIIDVPGVETCQCKQPPWLEGLPLKSVAPDTGRGGVEFFGRRVSWAIIVLSIILGILLITLILLLIMRFFVSKKRRDRKLNEQSYRMSSLAGRYHRAAPDQGVGAAFPASIGPGGVDRQGRRYNSDVPWYHWF